jgi:transposase InsO family protein
MSRRGDCYDNAVMEAFFSSVKSETADRFESYGRPRPDLDVADVEVFKMPAEVRLELGAVVPSECEVKAGQVLL